MNIKHEVEVLQKQISRLAMDVNALKAAARKNEVTDLYAPAEENDQGPQPLYEIGQFVFDIRCVPSEFCNIIPYQITYRMFCGGEWGYRIHDFIENNPPDSSTGFPEARLCGAGDWYSCNPEIMRKFYISCGASSIAYIDRDQNAEEPAWRVNCHKDQDEIVVDSVEIQPRQSPAVPSPDDLRCVYSYRGNNYELFDRVVVFARHCAEMHSDARLLAKEFKKLDRWLARHFPEEIR